MEILHAIHHVNQNRKPLVVLHGLFGQADNWNTLGKSWSNTYDVHLLDLRNHGRSFHSESMNFDVMAQDIVNYLDAHDIGETDILGHSLGGKAVMEFSLRYPERVKKLVVVDIAPKEYKPHHQSIIEALQAVPLSQITKRSEAEGSLKRYISDMPTRQFLLKNLHRKKDGNYAWRFNLAIIAQNYAQLIGENTPAEPFLRPSLFIAGGDSNYIQKEDEFAIASLFYNAIVQRIPKANHWVHATQPQLFSQAVLGFLQR